MYMVACRDPLAVRGQVPMCQHFTSFFLHQVCYYPYRPTQITWPSYILRSRGTINEKGRICGHFLTYCSKESGCPELPSKNFSPPAVLWLLGEFLLLFTQLLTSLWEATTVACLAKSAQLLYFNSHLIQSSDIYCGLYLYKNIQYMLSDKQYYMKEGAKRRLSAYHVSENTISFNPHIYSVRTLLAPSYRWENQSLETLTNLCQIT